MNTRERLAIVLYLGAVLAALFLMLCLGGCASIAPRDDWTTDHTVAEVSYQVFNLLDAAQTARIADRPDLQESMPLTRAVLGPRPDPTDTWLYFTTMGISHYLIARALPARWRPWFQVPTAVNSGAAVLQNCTKHGLLCPRGEEP